MKRRMRFPTDCLSAVSLLVAEFTGAIINPKFDSAFHPKQTAYGYRSEDYSASPDRIPERLHQRRRRFACRREAGDGEHEHARQHSTSSGQGSRCRRDCNVRSDFVCGGISGDHPGALWNSQGRCRRECVCPRKLGSGDCRFALPRLSGHHHRRKARA